ncbi:MAG TPA: TIGR01459 family HAD-type hydrolase [Geminicoccaceae bacterium]|nr:TIGR01459 family HAD-type hydrolase [Geminicoccaceae bacterium]
MPRSVPVIRGLREIAADYDALIVDLWGVIHGGVEPYPGVLETLAALRAAGRPVGLLSNAPRRARMVVQRLAEIGVPADAYDCLTTSGEAAHDALAARRGLHADLGRGYFYVGPHWDTDLADGLDYVRVDSVGQADFLLTVGLFDEADPLTAYDPLFAEARERGLVMLCANPDLVIHRQSGVTAPCAGLLAQRYEGEGGRVIYHGKPEPAVFHRCAGELGANRADARVLVVGDSLTTDIKGAVAAGYDSLWVTRGIYATELGIAPGDEPDPAKVLEVCERHGHWPTAAIAAFRW